MWIFLPHAVALLQSRTAWRLEKWIMTSQLTRASYSILFHSAAGYCLQSAYIDFGIDSQATKAHFHRWNLDSSTAQDKSPHDGIIFVLLVWMHWSHTQPLWIGRIWGFTLWRAARTSAEKLHYLVHLWLGPDWLSAVDGSFQSCAGDQPHGNPCHPSCLSPLEVEGCA